MKRIVIPLIIMACGFMMVGCKKGVTPLNTPLLGNTWIVNGISDTATSVLRDSLAGIISINALNSKGQDGLVLSFSRKPVVSGSYSVGFTDPSDSGKVDISAFRTVSGVNLYQYDSRKGIASKVNAIVTIINNKIQVTMPELRVLNFNDDDTGTVSSYQIFEQ